MKKPKISKLLTKLRVEEARYLAAGIVLTSFAAVLSIIFFLIDFSEKISSLILAIIGALLSTGLAISVVNIYESSAKSKNRKNAEELTFRHLSPLLHRIVNFHASLYKATLINQPNSNPIDFSDLISKLPEKQVRLLDFQKDAPVMTMNRNFLKFHQFLEENINDMKSSIGPYLNVYSDIMSPDLRELLVELNASPFYEIVRIKNIVLAAQNSGLGNYNFCLMDNDYFEDLYKEFLDKSNELIQKSKQYLGTEIANIDQTFWSQTTVPKYGCGLP